MMRLDLLRTPLRRPSQTPTEDLSLKFACPLCRGTGLACGVLEAPLVTWCGCVWGLRLRCAVPEDAWPLSFGIAVRYCDRIGLKDEYAAHARVRVKPDALSDRIGELFGRAPEPDAARARWDGRTVRS